MAKASGSSRLKYTELSARCTARKYFFGFRQRTFARPPPLRPLFHRIAHHAELPLLAANSEQHFIHGIVQFQQSDVRLKLELRIGAERRHVRLSQSRLLRFVEGFDFGPFQSHHVERDLLDSRDVLGMRAQP